MAGRLGQTPVDQQRLAVPTQHHVVRLQVTVQHPLAVGEGDRLADVDEPAQQLAELDGGRVGPGVLLVVRLDGLLEAVALDEPHGIERPAIIVGAQAVDRHDPGVLQAAVDLRLQHESAAEIGLGGLVGPDLLERDLAAELLVVGDVDPAQAALVVEPQDAEPLAGMANRGRGGRPQRAEGGINHRSVVRESAVIFRRTWVLAPSSAPLELDPHQLLQQQPTPRLCQVGQVILDPRPRSGLPGPIKLECYVINPALVPRLCLAHDHLQQLVRPSPDSPVRQGVPSSNDIHVPRIRSSLRSTVRSV